MRMYLHNRYHMGKPSVDSVYRRVVDTVYVGDGESRRPGVQNCWYA